MTELSPTARLAAGLLGSGRLSVLVRYAVGVAVGETDYLVAPPCTFNC